MNALKFSSVLFLSLWGGLWVQRLESAVLPHDLPGLRLSGPYATGELLVKWKDGPDSTEAAAGNLALGAEVERNFQQTGWQHVKLRDGMSVRDGMQAYQALGTVLAVEPNYIIARNRRSVESVEVLDPDGGMPGAAAEVTPIEPAENDSSFGWPEPFDGAGFDASNVHHLRAASTPSLVTPNDPRFNSQWNLKKISAPQAWAVTTGSSNVVVAVIDTGVNYQHPDLLANMWRNPGETGLDANGHDKATNGIDDDGDGYIDDVYGISTGDHTGDPIDKGLDFGGGVLTYHGSGLAGIIGAVGNNGTGIAGINWNVKLMAVAIREGTVAEFLEAVDYVIAMKKRGINVRVMSNSFFAEDRHPLKDAVDAAGNEGILTVFDANNNAFNNDVFSTDSPNSQWSISVAGSDQSDALVSYSNYGRSTVDLAAPTSVPTTSTGSTYYTDFSGDSAAQPHVAGAVALLAAAKPDATGFEIKAAIRHGVDQRPAFKNKTVTGGRLNLTGALDALTNTSLPAIVVGSLPVANQTRPDDLIEIVFSRPMDRASVEAAFQITPLINGTFQWTNNDQTLRFLHEEPFSQFLFTTNYTCKILGMARDVAGGTLDGNFNRTSEGSPADDFVWTFSLPVANDDFVNAKSITGREGAISGTTRYTTGEFPDEPSVTDTYLGVFSVWYQWTAGTVDWVTFDLTAGAKFDTLLAVFTGERLDKLVEVAANDNYGSQRASRLTFQTVPGTRYSIKVAAKYPGSLTESMWGDFLLQWYPTPAPGFTASELSLVSGLPGTPVTLTGTNFTGATGVLFNGTSAAFTNAVGDYVDLNITTVVPPNAISGPITVVAPHGSATSTTPFTVIQPPTLSAGPFGQGQIEFIWPASAVGFQLQQTDVLGPGAIWKPISAAPISMGDQNRLTLDVLTSTRYFRLNKP